MKIHKISHVKTAKKEADQWSFVEEATLRILVGTFTYEQIALRLGRTPSAVQLRASRLGLSPRAHAGKERIIAEAEAVEAQEARLRASEEDLAEFLVECDEKPAEPHVGGREYHREYWRKHRKEGLDAE